jgi:hypothetical protein
MKKIYILKSLSSFRIFSLAALILLSSTVLKAQGPGTALDYNQSENDYTTLPTGIIAGLTGNYTIEFWTYWEGSGAQPNDPIFQPLYQRVFDFGNNQTEWMFFTPTTDFGTFGATFALSNTGLSTDYVVQSPSKLPLNAWSHVALTYNAATTTASMYINGVLVGSDIDWTLAASALGNTINNWLGRSQFGTDAFYNGIIEEFRISNIVRYTTNFTPVNIQFTPDANTVALYHFNEGSGQTSVDATANFGAAILGTTIAVETEDPTWITNSILPVTVHQFTIQKSAAIIELKWRASSTGDGGKFIVERSANGSQFSAVGTIQINPNEGTYNYAFTDNSPLNGKNFYRIQVAEQGVAPKYSSVVWADMNGKRNYAVYPTLAQSELFISIPEPVQIAIYNASGVLVKRMQLQASQNIEVQDLRSGNYFITIEGSRESLRFIKL